MRETVISLLEPVPALIANGESLTSELSLGGLRLFGIVMPSVWTTANLTFQVSHDGGTTYNNLYDANGNEVTVIAGASRYIALDPAIFASVERIKVRSGTSGTPVNQGQDSTLQLVLRAI